MEFDIPLLEEHARAALKTLPQDILQQDAHIQYAGSGMVNHTFWVHNNGTIAQTHPLLLRIPQYQDGVTGEDLDIANECQLLEDIGKHIPSTFSVPQPIAYSTTASLWKPVRGTNLTPQFLSTCTHNARQAIACDMGALLACIQAIPASAIRNVQKLETISVHTFFDRLIQALMLYKSAIPNEIYTVLLARAQHIQNHPQAYLDEPDKMVLCHMDWYDSHIFIDTDSATPHVHTTGTVGLIDFGITAFSHPLIEWRYLYEDYARNLDDIRAGAKCETLQQKEILFLETAIMINHLKNASEYRDHNNTVGEATMLREWHEKYKKRYEENPLLLAF